MKKFNYFSITFYFFIFILNSCSYFKDKDEKKTNESYRPAFVQTIAKPDPSLRGLKVSLPKPVINNTWSQITNNEAHKVLHPLVDKKIKQAHLSISDESQNAIAFVDIETFDDAT